MFGRCKPHNPRVPEDKGVRQRPLLQALCEEVSNFGTGLLRLSRAAPLGVAEPQD